MICRAINKPGILLPDLDKIWRNTIAISKGSTMENKKSSIN